MTRPIFMGPGLRELALDRAHNVLYAATDIGVTALQLSMVPMPTGVKRIERDEIEFN
ncbi:MAG: hypothetical protein M5R36_03980 [Deltaproteobacteria bacterium]|nr:hypothetical protein [Deltaproteobacteria bacterium]